MARTVKLAYWPPSNKVRIAIWHKGHRRKKYDNPSVTSINRLSSLMYKWQAEKQGEVWPALFGPVGWCAFVPDHVDKGE